MSKSRFNTRILTTLALLTAIEIVLSRFLSINAWNIKIGFSFIPIVVAAILYGPIEAGIVAALGDFIGAILFPIGAYFPGFTLTAFLTGCVFGFFLHKKQGWIRIIAAVGINQFILSLFLNTFWISVLYGSPFGPLLLTRLVQCMLLTVVQLICIQIIAKTLNRYRKKGFLNE
jgi:ECF transporter S component (folate family)